MCSTLLFWTWITHLRQYSAFLMDMEVCSESFICSLCLWNFRICVQDWKISEHAYHTFYRPSKTNETLMRTRNTLELDPVSMSKHSTMSWSGRIDLSCHDLETQLYSCAGKLVSKFCAKNLHRQVLKSDAYARGNLGASLEHSFLRYVMLCSFTFYSLGFSFLFLVFLVF